MKLGSLVRWCNLAVIFLLSFALSLILGGEYGYSEQVRGVTSDTIKIGAQASITGPAADHFTAWVGAMRNYYRNINDQGGIHGRKIQLIIEDTRYSIPLSSATFKKLLYKDKIFNLFGPDGTGQTMVLKGQIEKLKVPSIGISQAISLVRPTQRYIFIAATPYENQISVMFDYLINVLKLENPRIAVVYLDIEYGNVCLRAAQERAKFYGIQLVDVEVISLMNMDSTSQVLNLKKANADYIIIPMSSEFAINVVKTAKKFKLKSIFFGNHYTCEDDILRNLPFPVDNFMGVNSYNSWYDKSPGMNNLKKISYKYQPEIDYRIRTYMQGWVSSLVWAEGFKRAGKDLTIEGFVNALESINKLETNGICGPITLGPDDHVAADYCRIYKADPDKKILAPITDWMIPAAKK
jgi:branched-chain amino acid transport system substrate-binding protein